jgi:LacI family sucrose operon transcriptional repressor
VLWREGDFTQDVGYFIALETLRQRPDLDGIICATDDMAVGAMKAAKELGRRVPEDVSVVGIGDGWAGQMMDPPLTTAHYYYRESGEDAAEMLLSLLGSETDVPLRQVMLGYELKLRGSL